MEIRRHTFFFRLALGPVAEDGEVGRRGGLDALGRPLGVDEDGNILEAGRGPRTKFGTVSFSAPVEEAAVALASLTFEYGVGPAILSPREHNLGRHMVRVWIESIAD